MLNRSWRLNILQISSILNQNSTYVTLAVLMANITWFFPQRKFYYIIPRDSFHLLYFGQIEILVFMWFLECFYAFLKLYDSIHFNTLHLSIKNWKYKENFHELLPHHSNTPLFFFFFVAILHWLLYILRFVNMIGTWLQIKVLFSTHNQALWCEVLRVLIMYSLSYFSLSLTYRVVSPTYNQSPCFTCTFSHLTHPCLGS